MANAAHDELSAAPVVIDDQRKHEPATHAPAAPEFYLGAVDVPRGESFESTAKAPEKARGG